MTRLAFSVPGRLLVLLCMASAVLGHMFEFELKARTYRNEKAISGALRSYHEEALHHLEVHVPSSGSSPSPASSSGAVGVSSAPAGGGSLSPISSGGSSSFPGSASSGTNLEGFLRTEYFVVIKIGSGKSTQEFELLCDTGSTDLWVPSAFCRSCDAHTRFDPCGSETYKQGYNPANSTTAHPSPKTFYIQYGEGSWVSGYISSERITLGDFSIEGQEFGEAFVVGGSAGKDGEMAAPFYRSRSKVDGIVGLGLKDSMSHTTPFFDNLILQYSKLPRDDPKHMDPVFSFFFANDTSGSKMFLGGVSRESYVGPMFYTYVKEQNPDPQWTLSLHSITIAMDSHMTKPFCADCLALMDTGTSHIFVPEYEFAEHFAAFPKFLPCSKLSELPDVLFTFVGEEEGAVGGKQTARTFVFTPEDYSYGLEDVGPGGEKMCAPGFVPHKSQNLIFGVPFMQTLYTVFDRSGSTGRIGMAYTADSRGRFRKYNAQPAPASAVSPLKTNDIASSRLSSAATSAPDPVRNKQEPFPPELGSVSAADIAEAAASLGISSEAASAALKASEATAPIRSGGVPAPGQPINPPVPVTAGAAPQGASSSAQAQPLAAVTSPASVVEPTAVGSSSQASQIGGAPPTAGGTQVVKSDKGDMIGKASGVRVAVGSDAQPQTRHHAEVKQFQMADIADDDDDSYDDDNDSEGKGKDRDVTVLTMPQTGPHQRRESDADQHQEDRDITVLSMPSGAQQQQVTEEVDSEAEEEQHHLEKPKKRRFGPRIPSKRVPHKGKLHRELEESVVPTVDAHSDEQEHRLEKPKKRRFGPRIPGKKAPHTHKGKMHREEEVEERDEAGNDSVEEEGEYEKSTQQHRLEKPKKRRFGPRIPGKKVPHKGRLHREETQDDGSSRENAAKDVLLRKHSRNSNSNVGHGTGVVDPIDDLRSMLDGTDVENLLQSS